MAVTVRELIAQREAINNKKKEKYDIKTSIGVVTFRKLTLDEVMEYMKLDNTDIQVIYETAVCPSLKDKDLLKAYGCTEPTDIVTKLFDALEIAQLSKKIGELSGMRDVEAELHKEIKK